MKTDVKQVDISYTFDFSIEEVFEAWVNPTYLGQWFAPHGCTIEFRKLDIRKGGSFHSCVHTPKLGDCWCIGTYFEITRNSKIVFSMVVADEFGNQIDPVKAGMDPEWPVETMVTVTFSEVDGKTIVNLTQTVSEPLAKKTGAYFGWQQMFERMELLIEIR